MGNAGSVAVKACEENATWTVLSYRARKRDLDDADRGLMSRPSGTHQRLTDLQGLQAWVLAPWPPSRALRDASVVAGRHVPLRGRHVGPPGEEASRDFAPQFF